MTILALFRIDSNPRLAAPKGDSMARYQFSPDDRSRGGHTTASRYDMRERGQRGLEKFAHNYFGGDVKKAGYALSKIGAWKTDPFPENGAFALPSWLPRPLMDRIGAPVADYGDIPF